MNDNLPPLPEPVLTHKYEGSKFYPLLIGPCFSLQQMREYGQLCRQQALEDAAKHCHETAMPGERGCTQYRDGYIDGFNRGADQCERAIRSMK